MSRTFGAEVPAYVAVYDLLYSEIMNDVYLQGDQLPSEAALAAKYGVSRGTLRQALAILVEDGLIAKEQGRESVVRERGETTLFRGITNPLVQMCNQTITGSETYYNFGPPTQIGRSKLGLTQSDIVLAATQVCSAGDVAVGYSFTQIAALHLETLSVDTASQKGIEQAVATGIFEVSTRALMEVKLVASNDVESAHLSVPEATPLFLLEWVLYGPSKEAFARAKFYLRPQFYDLRFQLQTLPSKPLLKA